MNYESPREADRVATPAEDAISYLDGLRHELNETRSSAAEAIHIAEKRLEDAIAALTVALTPPEDREGMKGVTIRSEGVPIR